MIIFKPYNTKLGVFQLTANFSSTLQMMWGQQEYSLAIIFQKGVITLIQEHIHDDGLSLTENISLKATESMPDLVIWI